MYYLFLIHISTYLSFEFLFLDSVQKDEKIEVNEKDKDTAKSTLSADEGTSTPKAKPSSWAALFKSNSDVATTKASTIISVNFPEAATKEPITEATKVIYDQPPKLIPVEKDQDALALAGIYSFLQSKLDSILKPKSIFIILNKMIREIVLVQV